MGIKTNIEYCDSTVNPVPGCSGCELYDPDPERNHCYAATLINRYAGLKGWPPSFTEPTHFPERLPAAIKWPDLTGTERPDKPWLNGMPRIIFVNDLGDLFAPNAPSALDTLAPHLDTMAESPHIYLILTKWPKRMMNFATLYYVTTEEDVPQNVLWGTTVTSQATRHRVWDLVGHYHDPNPLYQRIKQELRKWLSLEPLLGPVALDLWDWNLLADGNKEIDWVCAGGESGSNARVSHPDWFREIRDDCQGLVGGEEGHPPRVVTPFFFKQWGQWVPSAWPISHHVGGREEPDLCIWSDGHTGGTWSLWDDNDGCPMVSVGKKRAGRVLDGQEWSQMPTFSDGK